MKEETKENKRTRHKDTWSSWMLVNIAIMMASSWACEDFPTSSGNPVLSGPSVLPPQACISVEPDDDTFSVGETITLDAACSQNTNAATIYSWDTGDGRSLKGSTVEVSYEHAGDFVVQLEVTNVNLTSRETEEFHVTTRPQACFTWKQIPGSPPAPCTVRFDATCSTGAVTEYRWFFEGGPHPPVSLPDVTMTTTEPTIVYSWGEDEECFSFRPFERLVRLTVTDESGTTDEDAETIVFSTPFLRY